MTPLQLELTRLIGKKELTFGCVVKTTRYESLTIDSCNVAYENESTIWYETGLADAKSLGDVVEVIGHPATLSDFHRWIHENGQYWQQTEYHIKADIFHNEEIDDEDWKYIIPYDSSKDLLDQSEETLKQIIELITANSPHLKSKK